MGQEAFLLVELGAVILALGLLARLASRLAFSPIPLYLIAGLAFGEGGILPIVTSEEFIEIGAELGVIFLLLMLGLEYSARELVSGLRTIAPSGLLDLALNFSPGFLTGLVLGWGVVASLFLGGVTYVSSSGVVAKLLGDLGWIGNRETPVVLSILVFEDLAMAALLPILGAVALGITAWSAVLSVVVALSVITLFLYAASRHGERLGPLVFHQSDEVTLLSVFGLTLIVAGLAEGINISAAVGAFLVGIGLSGEAARRAHTLLSPLRDLFAAVFFVFFGLSTDPGDLSAVLVVAVILAVVTGGTKVITGAQAAKSAGIGKAGRLRAGVALIPRGEFSVIIAGLGSAAAGADLLAPLTAAYVLIMATAGPVAARAADSGRRRAAAS